MKWGMIGSVWGMRLGRLFGKEHRPDGTVVEFPMAYEKARTRVIEDILSGETAVLDPDDAPNLAQVVAVGLSKHAMFGPAKDSSHCEVEHLRGMVRELRDRLADRAREIKRLETLEAVNKLLEAEAAEWRQQAIMEQNKAITLRKGIEHAEASLTKHWKDWEELCTALGALINEVHYKRELGVKDGTCEEILEYVEGRLNSIRERYHVPF